MPDSLLHERFERFLANGPVGPRRPEARAAGVPSPIPKRRRRGYHARPMLPIDTRLARFASNSVRERGARYFAQRRVQISLIDDELVRASVQGSKLYHVTFDLVDSELVVACSCEHFESDDVVCKHIWATLLSVASRRPDYVARVVKVTPDESLLDDIFSEDDEDEDFDEEDLIDPRLAPGNVVPFNRPRAAWESFFQALESRARYSTPQRSVPELPAEILYGIDLFARAFGGVVYAVFGKFPKKNGQLGAPKRISVTNPFVASLPDEDREIISLLFEPYGDRGLRPPRLHVLLPRMARTGRLHLMHGSGLGPVLTLDERTFDFQVAVSDQGEAYEVDGLFVHGEESVKLAAVDHMLESGWFIRDQRLARFSVDGSSSWLTALEAHGSVTVPKKAQRELAAALASSPDARFAVPPELQLVDLTPIPKVRLSRALGDSWKSELRFLYGGEEIDPSARKTTRQGELYVRRRPDLERQFSARLLELGFRGWGGTEFHITEKDLAPALSRLATEEWVIDLDGESVHAAGELALEVSSGIDWFDVSGDVVFGEQRATLPQLLESIKRNDGFIRLDGGGIGVIDAKWVEQLGVLAAASRPGGGGMRFGRSQVTLIDVLFATQRNMTVDRDFVALREKLATAGAVSPMNEPPGFGAELRPYQRIGLGWLFFLREIGFAGILADDMGLGKTVQALALLETLRQTTAEERRPTLIVAPKSLMFNWKAEAARFAPEMRVLDHHGMNRARVGEQFRDYDLVLTTYATLQRDIAQLAPVEFEYVILDEAQAIKNAASVSAKAVKTLRARHRLALSGTPIENHVGELWSIFDFLNPGMLGTSRTFSRQFGKSAPPEMREKLARVVAPFVLRRTKQMVLAELPAKDEQTLWVELSDQERKQYDELRDHYRASLLSRVEKNGLAKSKMYVLEALLRLRQAALHPGLLDHNRGGDSSAKLDALEAELAILGETDHKALVFSQFTTLLDIVASRLVKQGVEFVRLDGRSRNREELVGFFQNDPKIRVFLISLKAGGVGLNLTAADYVYLLDPWWNPAVEAQAVDRAHRIGQQRKVTATRIVASGTVEEKILELQRSKKALADSIIQADEPTLGNLDISDLEMLLS